MLALILGASAGPSPLAAQPLQFRHLGVDDGLPSALVSDVVQDRRGFVWIGTAHGVSRYDGSHIRTYAHERDNRRSLPTSFVNQLYEDRGGTMWVVTGAGLSRYDGAHDGFVTYMARDRATTATARSLIGVAEDRRGVFWVGTSTGLYQFDPRTGREQAFAPTTPGTRTPSTRTSSASADSAPSNIEVVYSDRHGHIWVGTATGLEEIDPSTVTRTHQFVHDPRDPGSLPPGTVRAITEDAAGALWVGTASGGIARLDRRTGQFTRFRHVAGDSTTLATDRIARLEPDRAGVGLWIGTENGGLDHYDASTSQFGHHRFDPNAPSGISSNSVWSLFTDASGALWVGTYSGGVDISMPNGAAIYHFRAIAGDPTSLSYNEVSSFSQASHGHVWVATDGGGLNRFDPATQRFTRLHSRWLGGEATAVIGVHEDTAGTVWAATWGGGLSRIARGGTRGTRYTTANSDIPDENVLEVMEDHAGQLWIGTNDGTVAMLSRAERDARILDRDHRGRAVFGRRHAIRPPGLAPSSVVLLRELRDGTFAIGLRDGGVTILDPTTGRQTHHVFDSRRADGLSSNAVHALLEAEPGMLWVGTDEGLDRLELATGHATHYGESDGLPSSSVNGIERDDTGHLWLSTDRGISRFDPERRRFKSYTRTDGVQGGEFLMRSSFRASDGTLYFGGTAGFTLVRPRWIVENTTRPPVAITGLSLFNHRVTVGTPGSPLTEPIHATRELRLTAEQNALTLDYAALDFTTPEKVRYAYRLDGLDASWQDVGNQQVAAYTNLAPGHYTFRVRASNPDGEWNADGAALGIVIAPPLWQTWWFRLLSALVALAAVYRLLRFQQQRRLEIALGQQALLDPLTGLANRAVLRDRVAHALTRLARERVPAGEGPRVAVLFLDLDGFKAVNDVLGHHAGDELLRIVAARLLNATRGCDTVARFGGDEFAVLLENGRTPADARVVAERIIAAIAQPIPLGSGVAATHGATEPREAHVGVSVGLAFAEPGVDLDTLLRQADIAMYEAKADGKGRYAVFGEQGALAVAHDQPGLAGVP